MGPDEFMAPYGYQWLPNWSYRVKRVIMGPNYSESHMMAPHYILKIPMAMCGGSLWVLMGPYGSNQYVDF